MRAVVSALLGWFLWQYFMAYGFHLNETGGNYGLVIMFYFGSFPLGMLGAAILSALLSFITDATEKQFDRAMWLVLVASLGSCTGMWTVADKAPRFLFAPSLSTIE